MIQQKLSWQHLEEDGPPVGEGGHREATDGENYRAAEITMIILDKIMIILDTIMIILDTIMKKLRSHLQYMYRRLPVLRAAEEQQAVVTLTAPGDNYDE